MNGNLWVGTSNVVIPGNKSTFPEIFQAGSRLNYYSHIFNTVEVNRSFYKTPLYKTYERWSADVTSGFSFSIKLSREVTHAKDLRGDLSILPGFINAADGIGNKKGCLLVQFPGKIGIANFTKVEHMLRELQDSDLANRWKKVIEFRNPDWYIGETWEMLEDTGASMVLHDHPKARMFEVRGKPALVYIRLHGPKGDYRDSYSAIFLNQTANQIRLWLIEGKDVYCYFNNTAGSAYENALSLKLLLNDFSVDKVE